MKRIEFSIEDNGPLLEIGKEYEVEELFSATYFYMIENSLGMSHPIPVNQRLTTRVGRVVEKRESPRKIAILEFDEE